MREVPQFNPQVHDAIQESIQDVISAFVRLHENRYKLMYRQAPPIDSSPTDAQLASITFEYCHIGSRHAVEYLLRHHRELFQGIATMETQEKYGTFAEDNWKWHQAFIAKDQGNFWYIASPGNYNKDPKKDRLYRVLSGANVSSVLDKFIEQDGGGWSSPEFIEETFAAHPRALPIPHSDGCYYDGIQIQNINTVGDTRFFVNPPKPSRLKPL